MEYDKPFIIPDQSPDFENFAGYDKEYSFSGTNIWNNSFQSPEIGCDFAVLHNDLQEIKQLIGEISCSIKNFFREG
ncbi:MAG: hypothetical protein IKA10_08710 [Oscillospiraceae bacterium]|nr:hypothetical protein [Oscillospiraceae bacterium]